MVMFTYHINDYVSNMSLCIVFISLSVHCIGARVLWGRIKGFLGFWCLPQHSGGSDFTCTILNRIFTILEQLDHLPPVLILQLDNCGKENKNQFVIWYDLLLVSTIWTRILLVYLLDYKDLISVLTYRYLAFLIKLGVFAEIHLCFLPVGHTHNQIDQLFSVLARHLGCKDRYTLYDSIDICKAVFKNDSFNIHEIVYDIVDFKKTLEGIFNHLEGLGEQYKSWYHIVTT